jgi:hypothetical protein
MIGRVHEGEARIVLESAEDVWTATQRNLPLWDILEFFPRESVGPRGPADAPRPYPVQPVVVDTDLGWAFESDIQYGAWVFRPRAPRLPGMMRYCRERDLAPGDVLVFHRTDEGRIALRRERPPE